MTETLTRVFIHGLESTGRGTKGTYFRERYPGMIIEDYTGSLGERMRQLQAVLQGKQNLVMVGSSYGGLMATLFALTNPGTVLKLILLAPALVMDDAAGNLAGSVDIPVVVYHGRQDEIVPLEPTRRIAETLFTNLTYVVLEDNHALEAQFKMLDWDHLLCYECNH